MICRGSTFLLLMLSAAAVCAEPADGVKVALELRPGPDNPRNSEGAFLPLKDGRTMFAYSRYYGKSSSDHAAADIAARYSSDKGATWTDKDEIIVKNHGGMNVMSVSLLRLQSGEIALFYLLKNSTSDCRPVMRRSFDEGKTWSEPTMCITDEVGYYVLNNDRVIQLKDGRLLFAVSLHSFPDGKFDNKGVVVTYMSDDNGRTWRRGKSVLSVVAPDGKKHAAQEPGVVECRDGSVLLWIRTNAGCQYMCRSTDRGETFSAPQPSPLVAPLSPASIKRLPTGDLLAVWNDHGSRPEMKSYRQAEHSWANGRRTPLAAALSGDDGMTWRGVKMIESDPDGWFCYIAVEPLDDGTVLLGYCAYQNLSHSRVVKVPVSWFYAPPCEAADLPGGVEWVREVSSEKDRYCGWPSICDIGGGEFAVVFSGDRSNHVCPWGKVRMVRSVDGGETWSESSTVCNSVLDDRDAGLLRLKNGELVMFWFTSVHFYEGAYYRKNHPDYARHLEKLGMDAVHRDLGSFSRRSTDGGRTWEAPVRLPTTAPHGGIQLSDGRLVVVGNQYSATRGHMKADPEERAFDSDKPYMVVAESTDMGRSWRELARVPQHGKKGCEPHLIEAKDGSLRCYVRTPRNLLTCESRDGGRTWSPIVETNIPSWDNPPYLMRLKDGRVLLTYGRRVRDTKKDFGFKTGVFARVGDENATPASFESAAEMPVYLNENSDLGYASTVERADGSLLTVFYAHVKKPAASILAAKWRLK